MMRIRGAMTVLSYVSLLALGLVLSGAMTDERVEHGPVDIPTPANQTSATGNTSTNESAKSIGLAAPTTQSVFVIDERIARAVIHDGSIDHFFIAKLEQAADRKSK